MNYPKNKKMIRLLAKSFLVLSLLAFAAGTAFAAKFVKNASVGGYRIIVEGGGVEKRKEIQYDSRGNIVFSTGNVNLAQLKGYKGAGELDESLLGTQELNLDPMAGTDLLDEPIEGVPAVDIGALDLPIVKLEDSEDVPASEPQKTRSRQKLSSPWVATREIKKEQAQFAAAERKRLAEELAKQAEGELLAETQEMGEIMLDPSANVIEPLKTEDGRELPFFMMGGNRTSEVDGTAALKNYTKMNESLGGRAEAFDAEYAMESNENYNNIITLDQWHSKYSSIGQKRYDNVPESPSLLQKMFGFGDKRYDKKMSGVGKMWQNDKETSIAVNDSFARKIVERYKQSKSFSTELLLPNPNQGGISMQGINRYLFRRSHSDESGLPYIKPGNDKVEIKKQ